MTQDEGLAALGHVYDTEGDYELRDRQCPWRDWRWFQFFFTQTYMDLHAHTEVSKVLGKPSRLHAKHYRGAF